MIGQNMDLMRLTLENALEAFVRSAVPPDYPGLLPQLTYHMGWEGEGAGLTAQGKRLRPLLVLVASTASGEDWQKALPAAISVELVHNFSLAHDDVQDNSPLRRGRPTLWKKWGVAQAINSGDLLFTLAFSALNDLRNHYSPDVVLTAQQILSDTCTLLTGGQYLDLSYESRSELSLESYWPMITGKTAALIGASVELGALCAHTSAEDRARFRDFGRNLGLAFQVWDDWLGIWGDEAATGKSTASDLVSGKKSLPTLYGLSQNGEFARRWRAKNLTQDEIRSLAELLIEEGAQAYTEDAANRLTQDAMDSLNGITCKGNACLNLREMALSLLKRRS